MSLSDEYRRKFWSLVDKSGECWEWQGSITVYGYGQFSHPVKGLSGRAHRVSWEMENGPVPDGLVLDHLCRNRACVRPSHMEAVTNQTNVLRGEGVTAAFASRTECDYGHKLPDEPTSERGRVCPECESRRYAERLERHRLARSVVRCGYPTIAGPPCTRKVSVGHRCTYHNVWNLPDEKELNR